MRFDRRFAPIGRCALVAVTGGLLLAMSPLTAARARARMQEPPVSLSLYRGENATVGNVRLASWGSGKAEETRDNALIGDSAIKVTTHGLYQGGRLDFKTPVDLGRAFANPNTFMRLQMRFTGQDATQNNFNNLSLQTTRQAAAPFERMRFLLVMADGKQYELIRPIDLPPTEDVDAYVPIHFPLSAVTKAAGKPLTGDGAKLKSLAVFGDKYQQFQIGEVNVLTDETEISIAPLDDQIAFTDDEMTFAGSAEGGASTLRFIWDFDDRDGKQEDAVGRSVAHTFKKKGKYTVTLTVKDVDGLKKPQSVTLELEVSE